MKHFPWLPLLVVPFAFSLPLAAQPPSADERAVLDTLDVGRTLERMKWVSEEVVRNRSGAGAGTAVAGSDDERRLADFIEGELGRIGLSVRRETFPVRAYDYGEVSLRAGKDTLPAVSLHSAPGTWGTVDGVPYRRGNGVDGRHLEAALVDAGDGLAADYEGLGSVDGRVVLVHRTLWPSYAIVEAAHRGASAILFYGYGRKPLDDALKQDSVWYRNQIPAVSIRVADARTLQERLRAGETRVDLENRVDESYGFSENVIGTLFGSVHPSEWITISAHHDRWFQGAQDDSIGIASMIELARVLAAGYRPRRSLLFIAFGSEEAGVPATRYDWLAGSYAFVKSHPDVTSGLAYGFNLDLAGWPSEKGSVRATLDNLEFQRELVSAAGLSDRVSVESGLQPLVDAWNLGSVGGGAASYLSWSGPNWDYESYYHTQLDVARPENFENLAIDLRLGALGVMRADEAIVLPIRFSEVARWAEGELLDGQKKVADVGSDLPWREALAAATKLGERAARVEAAYPSIATAEAAAPVNAWLMRTRKELLPWLLSLGYRGATLKTTPYASDLTALHQAKTAAEAGDAAGASQALERVATMSWGKLVSPETYRTERLLAIEPAGWALEYDQQPRYVSSDLQQIDLDLKRGVSAASAAPRVAKLEAEAESFLSEALFLVTGKLEEGARALERTPIP
jgi:Iap family predicted aminopeptidase